MTETTHNTRPAVEMDAEILEVWGKANLYRINGMKVWIPTKVHTYDNVNKKITLQLWFYAKLVKEGKISDFDMGYE